jgi:4-hydroxybenzoate polyprenyltransferase
LRLVHPFPSVLDGAVVGVVALIAGADPATAARLGLSMTLLQFAIGALNDVVDAPRDAGRKPGKPIPAGLISIRAGRLLVAACAAGGLVLAAVSGLGLLLLALLVLAIGAAYDLAAKGTALSWAPFAMGIPLLPVFGWYGAAGSLPPVFLALVPIAAIAGAALAIANALVDTERDRAAGVDSIALRLGAATASGTVLALQVLVALFAIGTAFAEGAPGGWVAAVVLTSSVPVIGAGIGVVAATRRVAWREAAWEIQAVGSGLLAVAWLASLSASGGLGRTTGL